MIIDRFDGKYAFLSNFYDSNIYDAEGNVYPTVEHYFQAMKSTKTNRYCRNTWSCKTNGTES